MYDALQVFFFFVYATRNPGDTTTFYINSLRAIFSKPVFKTLARNFA